MPANRTPHCEWNVFIDHDGEPLHEAALTKQMRRSLLATLDIDRPDSTEAGGLDYYDVPVFEQLQLERLSHSALAVVCKELAVQCHMLINSLMMAIENDYGREAAENVALFQMTGSAWVMSERLSDWLGNNDGGIDTIINVLTVHPVFQPYEYIGMEVTKLSDSKAIIQFSDCPAGKELNGYGWFSLLKTGKTDGLEALLKGIDSKAVLLPIVDKEMTWEIVIDENVVPSEEPLPVQIAKGTVVYKTQLKEHISLL